MRTRLVPGIVGLSPSSDVAPLGPVQAAGGALGWRRGREGEAPSRDQLIVFLRLDTTNGREMRASPANVSALLLVLPFWFMGAVEGRRPNVLMVVGDDLGFFEDQVPGLFTPNYDALARRGVVFDNAFAQVCFLWFWGFRRSFGWIGLFLFDCCIILFIFL